MSEAKKYFTETAFLSQEGYNLTVYFENHLDKIFRELQNLNADENEIRTMSSLLMKEVGDMTSKYIQRAKAIEWGNQNDLQPGDPTVLTESLLLSQDREIINNSIRDTARQLKQEFAAAIDKFLKF